MSYCTAHTWVNLAYAPSHTYVMVLCTLSIAVLISSWLMCPRTQPSSQGQHHSIIISIFPLWTTSQLQTQDLSTSTTSWFNSNWLIGMWNTDLLCLGRALWIPYHWCVFPLKQGHSSRKGKVEIVGTLKMRHGLKSSKLQWDIWVKDNNLENFHPHQ